jgi:hypothetical protein
LLVKSKVENFGVMGGWDPKSKIQNPKSKIQNPKSPSNLRY